MTRPLFSMTRQARGTKIFDPVEAKPIKTKSAREIAIHVVRIYKNIKNIKNVKTINMHSYYYCYY
jgi:hypothetical protein